MIPHIYLDGEAACSDGVETALNSSRQDRRQDNTTLWVVLGVAGGGALLLALICGGVIYLVTSTLRSGAELVRETEQQFMQHIQEAVRQQQQAQQAQQTARAFLDDLLAGRFNAAHAATSAEYRRRVSPHQLAKLMTRYALQRRLPLTGADVQPVFAPTQYRYVATAVGGEPIGFTVTLVRQDNAWKIDELTVDGPQQPGK